jgi:hypothetical protein
MSSDAETLIAQVVRRWIAAGVAIRAGVSEPAIRAFEDRNGVRLSHDIARYFETVDGMPEGAMDESGLRFWGLSEVAPALSEIPSLDPAAFDGVFVFADYMIWSHGYGARLVGVPQSEVVVVGGERPLHVSKSFLEFLQMYIEQPELLFPRH